MQDPRSNSTLELVVNEQQHQNMSQIDLSTPTEANQHSLNNTSAGTGQRIYGTHPTGGNMGQTGANPAAPTSSQNDMFSFEEIKKWPNRLREGLSEKLDSAKAKSDTKLGLVCEILQSFSGIFLWVICFLSTIIVPVILFIVGLSNLDNCTERPSLPYLVFAIGFVMSASNLFNLAISLDLPVLQNQNLLSADVKSITTSIVNIIFNCVAAFLYILIAYMVYTITAGNNSQALPDTSVSDDQVDTRPTMECSGLLYHFTFWFITITLGLVVILCALATILALYNRYRSAIIRGSTPRSQTQTNQTVNGNQTPALNSYTSNRL